MGSGITWWGCALMTLCFAAFAVLLARATRPKTPSSATSDGPAGREV